jgi:hypothetical protein
MRANSLLGLRTSLAALGATAVAALVLGSTGVGCGGGGGAPPTTTDFCTQKAKDECLVNCAPITTDQCVAHRKQLCLDFATGVTAGGTRVFTPANQSDCLNRTKSAYSGTAPITPATMAQIDRACNYVFQGNKQLLSDACQSQYECAGTTDGSIVCDKGFCAKQSSPKPAGTPCGNPGDVCATGTYCATSGAVPQCTARAQMNDSCAEVPCLENLRCVNGSCAMRSTAGGACLLNDDCPTSGATYCNPYAGNICAAGLTFSNGSASCNDFALGTGGGGTDGGPDGAGSGDASQD